MRYTSGAGVSHLAVATDTRGTVNVLTVEGVLDSSTYPHLRDSIVKAGLDGTDAVVVDISELHVPVESAYAVFTSACWRLSRWPDVPLFLACRNAAGRDALARHGVIRYVPVHRDADSAIDARRTSDQHRVRRRVREELQRESGSVQHAHVVITETLLRWSHQNLIAAANAIATELIQNVLDHTSSKPGMVIESDGSRVTVAVADASSRPAILPEPTGEGPLTGLQMVASLSRAWGTVPVMDGKTVWATIEPSL
jgi:hypothetical protein